MWAQSERLKSRSELQPNLCNPRSAPAPSSPATPAHRSAPLHPVASLGRGQTAPMQGHARRYTSALLFFTRLTPSRGWHPTKITFLWLNLERTLDKRRRNVWVVRRRQLKRSLGRGRWLKKVVSFLRIKVTPSVAAPGDTNLKDATGSTRFSARSAPAMKFRISRTNCDGQINHAIYECVTIKIHSTNFDQRHEIKTTVMRLFSSTFQQKRSPLSAQTVDRLVCLGLIQQLWTD